MQRTESEIDLRITVAAAMSIANDNPSLMVSIDTLPNRDDWEVLTGGDVDGGFLIEAGDDLEETVGFIKRVRGI